jgi:hypothetical protein
MVASISGSTIWRWLHEDAIRPWCHRSWIFPRDPAFAVKAGRILDLYARCWNGKPLSSDEYVISADEKTSIQARRRKHATLPAAPSCPVLVEHEYDRCGAWRTWPLSTFIMPASLAVAKPLRASRPLIVWWSKS